MLQIIKLRLYVSLALRDEEVVRSPAIVDEATNDERASTEMELYENEEDADYMENELKFLEDETAILGKNQFLFFFGSITPGPIYNFYKYNLFILHSEL